MRFPSGHEFRVVKNARDIEGGIGSGSLLQVGDIVTIRSSLWANNTDDDGEVTIRDSEGNSDWIHPDCLEPLDEEED